MTTESPEVIVVHIANPDQLLRPGMPAQMQIGTP